VEAWAPPDDGEGMDLDPVTDLAGAGDGDLMRVVGLGTPSVQGQESVSSQREQAGQRRDPDYVRRRQAKHTAKQNARRKRG
jgi:hypothetical protein